ncbi:MAG: hypothetical protein CMM84_05075 [Rhodothermaceae bacterium]|nr:hypothetical protein [Rhodothermaceae bacterium]
MRRFVPFLLAVLVLAPVALAQSLSTDAPTRASFMRSATSFAPGDTTYLTNIPPGTTSISTFSNGNGDFLFGTGGPNIGVDAFGAGYVLPDDGAVYEIIGGTLFVTATPDEAVPGQTFEVFVYEGTIQDGPQGDPVYSEVFPSSTVPPVSEAGVAPTETFFSEPVSVSTSAFFIAYNVDGITTQFGGGSTNILPNPTPETVFLSDGDWLRVDEEFSTGGENPQAIQVQLFSEAVIRQFDPDGNLSTIGEARAAGDGATVTVEGVVTRSAGAFTYLQDETGGLAIRQTSGAFFDEVQATSIRPGRILRVTGTLSEFNGLLQINGGALESYAIRGATAEPLPQEVTLAELASNGEAYESELVLVPDVTFTDLADNAPFEAATTYAVSDPTDASNAVSVRVPNAEDSDADGTDFTGSPARVRGVLGQNSAGAADVGYQILLIRGGDVQPNAVAVGESPDGRLGLSGVAPNPSAEAGTVTVSLAAAGPVTLTVVDVLGREVARVLDGPLAAGAHPVRLDVSALPAGTYLVRLTADGATAVRSFTVAR